MLSIWSCTIIILMLVGLNLIGKEAVATGPRLSMGPYKSGYAQGCSDVTTGNHDLLKTKASQNVRTPVFEKGYNEGYNVCSNLQLHSDNVEQLCIGILNGNLSKSQTFAHSLGAASLGVAARSFCGIDNLK